ncbi:MAG: hypothetical protein IPQ19_06890 [Bacteroidetes bacterium]|nr:hypothetical protein [Bacteroidota bacterium]
MVERTNDESSYGARGGTYTVTVKDRNSCPQHFSTVVVNEPTELQVM